MGADHMYELGRVRLPFHGIVGRRCAGVHHLGNQLHEEREFAVPGGAVLLLGVAHSEGLHEGTEGLGTGTGGSRSMTGSSFPGHETCCDV